MYNNNFFLFGTGVTPVAPLHLIGQLGLTRELRVWQLSMQDLSLKHDRLCVYVRLVNFTFMRLLTYCR